MFKRSIFDMFLISALTIAIIDAREIEVPSFEDYNAVNVKLGLTKEIQQPQFQFSKVYRRQVKQVGSVALTGFPPCVMNKPEVQFDTLDQIVFEGIPKKPNVITQFDDIKYSQFLLDVYYEDLKIFMMFKNKKVAVITLETDDKIKDKIVFDVSGNFTDSPLEVGYFIKVDTHLLFVNNNFTILVHQKSASIMPGYYPFDQFESVISLQNSTFAVLQKYGGFTVFHFDGAKVRKVQKVYSSRFLKYRQPELQDIAYWQQKKSIILLDRNHGIMTAKINFKFDPATLADTQIENQTQRFTEANENDTKSKLIDASQPQQIAATDNCRMMYLKSSNLYVFCGTTTAYDLSKWPKVKQTKLPYPNIQVKQIFQVDDILAFVGRNVFTLTYLQEKVNYYEDTDLDKLIFSKDLFISASEEGVEIGNYRIIKPYLTCYTKDENYVGVTHLQFKTYAECNQTYFQKYHVNKSLLGDLSSEDICVYTVYKPINIWMVGQIKTYPFLFALLGLAIIIFVLVLIFISKKIKLYRVVAMVQQYSKATNSESAQPQHFNQQLEEQPPVGSEASKKSIEDKTDDKKQSQIQLAQAQKNFDI